LSRPRCLRSHQSRNVARVGRAGNRVRGLRVLRLNELAKVPFIGRSEGPPLLALLVVTRCRLVDAEFNEDLGTDEDHQRLREKARGLGIGQGTVRVLDAVVGEAVATNHFGMSTSSLMGSGDTSAIPASRVVNDSLDACLQLSSGEGEPVAERFGRYAALHQGNFGCRTVHVEEVQ
jgi:hypothetical protein